MIESTSEAKKQQDEEEKIPVESKISKTLSDWTIRATILLILVMLFMLPIFDNSNYISFPDYSEILTMMQSNLQRYGETSQEYQDVIKRFIDYNDANTDIHNVMRLKAWNYPMYNNPETILENYWDTESVSYATEDIEVWIYYRWETAITSYINIARTIMICILLTVGALFFTRDAEKLVLNPIERMIEKVKVIAWDPLAAANGDFENAGIMNQQVKKTKKVNVKDQLETNKLEETISWIGFLLALGYGEAGAKIIASNIKSGGDLNPMMQG